MKVLGRSLLFDFCSKHSECRKWAANWLQDAASSRWQSGHEVVLRYPAAELAALNIIIFKVRGNEYRMEILVAYNVSVITIKWIGTHDQYVKRMR
jgi:mRNA interferase HigB